MSDNQKKQRGIDPDPAETNRDNQQQQQQGAKEGDFRNAETAVNKASDFDDDYESTQENQMTEEEARTERQGRDGKSS
jgi:hypothetical protein